MGRKKVTITEVAKEAGVSLATVSRIFNNKEGKIKISETTKQKVLKAAAHLGYQTNPFAAALRAQKTGIIGILIRDLKDPFLIELLKKVQQQVQSRGMDVLIGHTDYEETTAERQLNVMMNHWFDGVILLDYVAAQHPFVDVLKQYQTPYVSLTGDASYALWPIVHVDDAVGMQLAVAHLTDLGHKNIGFVGKAVSGVEHRLSLFYQYVPSANAMFVKEDMNNSDELYQFINELAHHPEPPTALICATDYIALKVIHCAWQNGLHVPADLSVIGFDDITEASEAHPPLTTIHQPMEKMAEKAVNLLLQQIQDQQEIDQIQYKMAPVLVERETTKRMN
ncbi:LacI family DNA-binding transcriptional regulator [Priestia megaterium]|uniref:LacI family DNA-binding transcriptional regulator n=1 Tax=Priestia megaterium TaxID=1404 RepID=UPI000BF5798B|nr:LacI family DNA-binding transcriptional regulator [Priestia megaterium]PFK96811.1 LacI family transcriptional regulator [Priestia megaterium]RCX22338.1 LacI family transcriptional regulator [Bacillus sp. AG236]